MAGQAFVFWRDQSFDGHPGLYFQKLSSPVSVVEAPGRRPRNHDLHFTTTGRFSRDIAIHFELAAPQQVSLELFDAAGRRGRSGVQWRTGT